MTSVISCPYCQLMAVFFRSDGNLGFRKDKNEHILDLSLMLSLWFDSENLCKRKDENEQILDLFLMLSLFKT